MIKKFNLISCCDLENGIGISSKNDLPWILKKEYQYFQFVTQRIDNDLSFLNQFKLNINSKSIENELIRNVDDNLENKSIDNKKTKQELLFNNEDLNNYQIENQIENQTICNCIIMGRRTWQSLPENYRPLKNRLNLVISRQYNSKYLKIDNKYLFKSLKDALKFATKQIFVNDIFIVGGEQLYKDAIKMNECKKIYLTRINSKFNCDKFFPPINNLEFKEIDEFNLKDINQYENNLNYKFYVYERI